MSKAERLNDELLYLADRASFQLKDLEQKFHISRKTAWRDLQSLEDLGLAFYSLPGRGGGYKIINDKLLTKMYFNNDEVNAIFFALKALRQMSATPFSNEYERIYQKLLQSLSQKHRQEVQAQQKQVNYRQQPSLHKVKYFNILLNAAINNWILEIENKQYFQDKHEVQVYEIFYQTGNWFCHVFDLKLDRFFILRCDKITFCHQTGKSPFTYSDLKKKLQQFDQTYYNFDFSCEITSHGKSKFLLNPYPKMNIKIHNNKYYLTGKINNQELDYLADYLVGFSTNIKNIQPQKLKRLYLQKLERMITNNI